MRSRSLDRSIPAHAGEPRRRFPRPRRIRVYPRPCGGTSRPSNDGRHPLGLSPPVRGNRYWRGAGRPLGGSIPARAGEPRRLVVGFGLGRVYPRPCGGTSQQTRLHRPLTGLSPPVRGNPARPRSDFRRRRSIPARAGEPARPKPGSCRSRVYPRPCGGTIDCRRAGLALWGLSPPTRGNPLPRHDGTRWMGSIPAHAGEPHEGVR